MKSAFIVAYVYLIIAGSLSLIPDHLEVEYKKPAPIELQLQRLFPSPSLPPAAFDEAIIASPLLGRSQNEPQIIVSGSNGEIALLDTESGTRNWNTFAPTSSGQLAELVSTPALVGDKLIVLYQCLENGERRHHRVAVLDLSARRWDDAFPILELSAEKPASDGRSVVEFNPPTAYSHAALTHVPKKDGGMGIVYAAFGNAGDTQPFHGWLFEIDLDSWRERGTRQAVTSSLLTTPEAECPVTVEFGTQEMICGGGIWTPAGPQVYPAGDSYAILVPTGNGQIDLARGDYANTLMRIKPGLEFDPACDRQLCANFDPAHPAAACVKSCKNLFIPRLAEENAPLKPASGECGNKDYAECLAWMDYDLGANAPVTAVLPDGRQVIIQAGKDGGVSLLDADHLGTQFDRVQIAEICGTPQDPCKMSWAGMIVTQPVLSYVDSIPVVIIPTFMPDQTHAAGLVALKIGNINGKPKFAPLWRFPDASSVDATKVFRSHPSLPVVSRLDKTGDEIVWVVDINPHGILYGIRVRDGRLLIKTLMQGTGRPLSAPVIFDDTIYIASSLPDTGQGILEGFKIELKH